MKKQEGKTKKEGRVPPEQEELVGQLQRLQAEFENYKRRVEQERESSKQQACATFISGLLPIIDNFELALTNTKSDEGSYAKGVEMIYAQLRDYLEGLGVTEIAAKGKFDPTKHEALMTEERKGAEEGTIIEVLQRGYELHGRVLRTAKVKVAK